MDQDKKDKTALATTPSNTSFVVAVISVVIALIMTRINLGDYVYPYPGTDAVAERNIREKLIKCYNKVDPKKYSEIITIMKEIKGKESEYLNKLKSKYSKYEECDPNATGLLTSTNKPPPSKKTKKDKKDKKKKVPVIEEPIEEEEDLIDEPDLPENTAQYVGCYGSENVFVNKVYGGGSNGAYYQLALSQAAKLNKKYFAIARHEFDGHSFSFSDFSSNHMDYSTEGEGCERVCVDAQSQPCGCVDDLCDGPNFPGEEHNRRWAVYAVTS